jgi:hypothetical protein
MLTQAWAKKNKRSLQGQNNTWARVPQQGNHQTWKKKLNESTSLTKVDDVPQNRTEEAVK